MRRKISIGLLLLAGVSATAQTKIIGGSTVIGASNSAVVVKTATPFSPAFYGSDGSIQGTAPLNGIIKFSATGVPTLVNVGDMLGALQNAVQRQGENPVPFSSNLSFTQYASLNTPNLVTQDTTFVLPQGFAGQDGCLVFKQDSVGGHVVTPPSDVKGFSAVGTAPNAWSSQCFSYSAFFGLWLAQAAGYSYVN